MSTVTGSATALLAPSRLAAVDRARRLRFERAGWPDALARLVAHASDAPLVALSLIGAEDLTVLGAYGAADESWRDGDVPFSTTLSDLVVFAGDPVIVDDTRLDERFADRAVATAGLVGAFVGFPVRDGSGEIIGAVSALDRVARNWMPKALSVVEDAAQIFASAYADDAVGPVLDNARAAEQDRAFLEALLDSLQTGVSVCDADGRLVRFNRAMRDALGTDADRSMPSEWADHYQVRHLDGRPVGAKDMPLARALRGESVRDADQAIMAAGQNATVFQVNAEPIFNTTGAMLGAVAAVQDVTERRRSERFRDCELAVATALAAATGSADAVRTALKAVATTLGWVHAELWLVDDLAQGLRQAATWTRPDLAIEMNLPIRLPKGAGLAGLVWESGKPEFVADMAASTRVQTREASRTRLLHGGLAVPVRGGDTVLGVLKVFSGNIEQPEPALVRLLEDVAVHIGQFVERRHAEELVLELARTKDEYIALVGHEMRTPLASIASYTELIRDTAAEVPFGEIQPLLDVVSRNVAQLRGVVDDLLDLASLDSGHVALRREPVDLAGLITENIAAVGPIAATQGVTIHRDLPAVCVVDGDPLRLRQVVDNVVANAVKYSPDGGVIDIRLRQVGAIVEVVVSDSGIGIPDDEREAVFRRLFRGARGRDRQIPGSGLGLAICRLIIERHGGTIAVAPRDGPGTAIVVRLPNP